MSTGLNMILNDVRPGNCCSLSCGYLSVAAVTAMKLQLTYICAASFRNVPLHFARALALLVLLMQSSLNL